MSHKVHPEAYRLGRLANWHSRWLDEKKLPQYLEEDFKIREFLNKKIGKLGVEKIEIERFPGKINIIIFSARPGLIIGRGGEGVEVLKKALENKVLKSNPSFVKTSEGKTTTRPRTGAPATREALASQPHPPALRAPEVKIEIREIKNPWSSAVLSGQWIAQQIEKRVRFRRVLKQALEKITATKGVQGARVQVAGRLDGAEISRTEWLKKGKLPRQTLRAEIDFARERAYCTYGVIGIKVWIYKGERFD